MEEKNQRRESSSRKNPIEYANLLSKLFFWWMIDFFRKSVNRDLEIKDLYETPRSDRSELLGDELEREWEEELAKEKMSRVDTENRRSCRKPSLLRCIIRIFFWSSFFKGLLVFFMYIICINLQSYFLGLLIGYFDRGSSMPTYQAYWYAAGIVGATMLFVASVSHAHFGLQRIGMQIRVACSSLIYRKITRLGKTSSDRTAGGQIVNLLSNDVHRFDICPVFIHFIWIMPIELVLVAYLVWADVGVFIIAGITALIMQTIPLQGYISKLLSQLRSEIAEQTDKRIQIMSEFVSRIEVIKMYGWEKYFQGILNGIRKTEVQLISLTYYCRGFYLGTSLFAGRMTIFVILLTLTLTGRHINPKLVFILMIYAKALQLLAASAFPQAIVATGEALVSIRRIEEYLRLEEPAPKPQNSTTVENDSAANFRTGITARKLSATRVLDDSLPVLKNLSFEVSHGQLCALVGLVGSGKSSTLQLILGELLITGGELDVKGKTVSYVAQESWLFEGTVKENILFGLPYIKTKYHEVTKVCALEEDFRQLPQGHLTLVGERGGSLSGGQRSRVHLARAIYRDADIYLIDDPFSAVDVGVGRQIFEGCITGYLRGKTRILVTNHTEYLEKVDRIILLKNGSVQSQGTFERLMSSDPDFRNFVDIGQSIDEIETESDLFRQTSERILTSLSQTPVYRFPREDNSSDIKLNEEKIADGRMSFEVYKRYFKAGGSIFLRGIVITSVILSQVSLSSVDYWLTFWTNQESIKQALTINRTDLSVNSSRSQMIDVDVDVPASSNLLPDQESLLTTTTCLGIYAGLIISCIVFALACDISLLQMCLRASKTLHDQMLENLTHATVRFFNTNPAGRILNRFSKDIGTMDELLPMIIIEAVMLLSTVIGSLVLIIVGNYWMTIPIIFVSIFCLLVSSSYLATMRGIVRLEGVGKSPMLSHVSDSLEGLLTIRSTESQQMMIKEFDDRQNVHTSVWFMSIASGTAFGFYLSTMLTIFLGIVSFTFVMFNKESTLSVDVGLAVVQAIALVDFVQYGLQEAVRVIAKMTSVERVLEYTNLPREDPFDSRVNSKPPIGWPQFGRIEIKNLSLKYSDGESNVLTNINVEINPRQKIGIVGRTGAGKSSLIAALFRLEKFEGSLTIDGIDSQSIGLNDLRSKISIIPQEPTLFGTTLRQNLDPFNEFSDDYLWAALDEIELRGVFTSLDFQVREGGSNLSLGERQLISLARAGLRNNKIVVLDEATANIDSVTEALILATVRRKFVDCTVLTIAHKLDTIIDSDRVLVLQAGQAVEFDHPYKLLENQRGHFTSMVKGTGPANAERLTKIAQINYEQRETEITRL